MPKPQDLPAMDGPGVGHKRISEIESAADKVLSLNDKIKRLRETKSEADKVLLSKIQKHRAELGENGNGETVYRYDDLIVIVTEKMQIKIKEAISAGDEE